MTALILASSSPYRRELLERLRLDFAVDAPHIDETPLDGETVAAMVLRLAVAKAQAVAERSSGAVIIGSDQAAGLRGRILGKPGTPGAAVAQLMAFSGRCVDFYTGLALVSADRSRVTTHLDHTIARFRELTEAEVERYVERDRPLDCAGGIKFEGTGTLLLTAVETRDPSAAIGLPLIELGAMLRDEGINPLADPAIADG